MISCGFVVCLFILNPFAFADFLSSENVISLTDLTIFIDSTGVDFLKCALTWCIACLTHVPQSRLMSLFTPMDTVSSCSSFLSVVETANAPVLESLSS